METRKPAPPTGAPKPIEYRQLCAIAREQLQLAPTMDDSEWAERIKDRLVRFGFDYPRPDQITAAMSAVEYALSKTLGPRPVRKAPVPAKADAPADIGKPTPAEWARMARIVQRLQAPAQAASVVTAPPPRETFDTPEDALLELFYKAAQHDRLAALKTYAEFAVLREAGWNPDDIRRQFEAIYRPGSITGQQCFGCLSSARPMAWHHVIQIQHGGSNTRRNILPVCVSCHADIHPWLPAAPRVNRTGWKQIFDVGLNAGVFDHLTDVPVRTESA